MLLYILRFDPIDQIKVNATQIWKTYVDNTPKTIKKAFKYLLHKIIQIVKIEELSDVSNAIIENFCQKYGEDLFKEVIAEVGMMS